jgi:ribosomal protein S12 methylthiotransferase accessory factor
MVTRPNSRSVSVSQGKGFDLAAAKASGVMESIESYHAERMDHSLKLGSYEDLRYSHRLVDVEGLPRHSDSRFTPYTRLLWVEGRDIMGDGSLWLPFEMVHLDYTLPLPSGHGCFVATSNGLASGNHLLEAVCHSICEIVERDATTLWHLLDSAAQGRTRLDLDTVDDPCCRALLERYEDAGVMVAVWETTSDLGVVPLSDSAKRRAALQHASPGHRHGLPHGPRGRLAARADGSRAKPADLHFRGPRRHGP